MSKRFAVATLVALLLSLSPLHAQITAGGCTMKQQKLVINFPFGGSFTFPVLMTLTCPETEWNVFVRNSDRGLQIFWASLRRAPNTAAIPVLTTANVVENITLYHTGNVRLNDTQFANATNAIPRLFASDLDANGMLITLTGETTPRAAAELRSRGFAWYCTWGFGDPANDAKAISRRGMEMVIWGIWDTGNYDYIYEYHFRDDGQIGFRAGATGWNNQKDIPPDTAHTHDLLWRVHMGLGSGRNTARLFTHQETTLSAVDSDVLFNNGIEGSTDVDPVRWATVLIEDDADSQSNPESRNAHGNKIGYELQASAAGVGRHYGPSEEWTHHDSWVTRYQNDEADLAFGIGGWQPLVTYLIGNNSNHYGVNNQESIQAEAIVLWHATSAHHEPHDEDQAANDPSHEYKGITLIHWMGFDLVPHNLFDANPLGGPHRQTCNGPS